MDTFTLNPPTAPLPTIDPDVALELRVRWLEAIIVGVKDSSSGWKEKKGKEREDPKQTLVRLAEDVQRTLDAAVDSNDGLKRFMEHCQSLSIWALLSLSTHTSIDTDDQYAHLLTPAFALSGAIPEPPTYDDMSSEELDAFLTEMEPDIRTADRDLREIEVLVQKGITEAGKLWRGAIPARLMVFAVVYNLFFRAKYRFHWIWAAVGQIKFLFFMKSKQNDNT